MAIKATILSFAVLLFASTNLVLAEANIKFSKTRHDFGTIQEKDGDVQATFEYTNTGTTPLLVTRATASCGCTSPSFSKKPLAPGAKERISVTYHAKGRPGAFDKSIYVYTNDSKNEYVLLTITGNVVSATGTRESYSVDLGGGLRVKNTTLNFFDVYPTRPSRTRLFPVYNDTSRPMMLTFRNVPDFLEVYTEPAVIQPRQEGRVKVVYHTDKVKDWGPRQDSFDIFVAGMETHMEHNHINILADIWEDFAELTQSDRQQCPEIEVTDTSLDFTKKAQGNKRVITVRNTGKERLTIRKIHNESASVFVTTIDKTALKPGETANLTVVYHPENDKNRSRNQHFTIISNDPFNSRVIVSLKAGR